MTCTLHYGFHHNMCPRCGTLPGVKPQMEEPTENTDAQTTAENTDAQTIKTESPEMEARTEMEKTTHMEEASMVAPPWRRHRGVSTGSGSTSRGDHEEPRRQGHTRRLEEPDE